MAKLIRHADRIARRSVETAANDRQKAVTLALDVEPLLNVVDVLLTAATIIVPVGARVPLGAGMQRERECVFTALIMP